MVEQQWAVFGRVALGVTNTQRAVAQETVLALDMTARVKGDKDPER